MTAALADAPSFPFSETSKIVILSAGKAAWGMARAAHDALGSRIAASLVSGPRGQHELPPMAEWIDAAHPLPDEASVRAGTRALALATEARARGDAVLVLLSGGGSSMLCAPAPGIRLEDKRFVIDALMRRGADIRQLNGVRKHLSALKGGRLAAAAGRSLTLAISDVHDPEDDPGTIASGPTVADRTTGAQAFEVLDRFGIDVPASVRAHLEMQADAAAARGNAAPPLADFRILANRRTAMDGAAAVARRLGYAVRIHDAPTRGEAREAGRQFVERALALIATHEATCVIASGETTVRVVGRGTGGRNQEFVLGAAEVVAAAGRPLLLASAGTDGIDGPTDAAGGIVTSTTLARATAAGIDVADVLARNDAYSALARLDALVVWGPTGTNIGDLHLVLTMRTGGDG